MMPLLCFVSLVPWRGAAAVLYTAGGAHPGHDAALACPYLLALGWASVGDATALKTARPQMILGPRRPSVGHCGPVAESGAAYHVLLGPGDGQDDPLAVGGHHRDIHADGCGQGAVCAEYGCGPVRGQGAVHDEAGRDQADVQAVGRGQAEHDAAGGGGQDPGAVQPAVRGGHEMSLAALGSGQAERDDAGGCGRGDQGAVHSAVQGGHAMFPAALGSGQADLHAGGDEGQENLLAGAGGGHNDLLAGAGGGHNDPPEGAGGGHYKLLAAGGGQGDPLTEADDARAILQAGGGGLTEPDSGGGHQDELTHCLPVPADPQHELTVGEEGEEGDIQDTPVLSDASATQAYDDLTTTEECQLKPCNRSYHLT